MRPWPEPGARKEEEAMKKLFALLMALTMTVQLVTPAWADAVEEGPEESTEAVEVVQETTEATEETEVPEETEAETKETEAAGEVTEPESEAGKTTEEPTEETAEPTETGEEAEDEQVAAVAALIEALPSVEELEGMTEEEQLAAYEQIQGAFDAYDALTDEQKTQIYGAEELFKLLEYYVSQISVEASFCGTGTEGSPYLISTEEELRQLAQDVENGSTYVNECFQLENDIDLTEEWIPIGTEQVVFRGSFDGNGHTISNLSGTGEHLGLFAYVGGGAQITNVNVADVRFEKGPFLAGIAAEVDTSEGDVLIQNCHVLSGSIKGIDDEDTVVKCLAGIVGNSSGDNKLRITDCSNSAQILAGSDSYTSSGIAGNVVDATITRCANYGYVAGESDSGGICGNAIHSSFIACVNYAKVTTYYGAGISDGNNNIFSNCLNVGMINNDSDGRGYPIGKLSAGNTYENCHYLKGCFRTYKFPQDSTQTGKEVTKEQLASGEAAYGLGQYFGQTLGEDTFPVFRTESNQVYKVSVSGAIEKTFFVNMNQTVPLPSDPELSYYLDENLFDADTPITEDTELVAVKADHVLVKTDAVAPTNTTTGNNEYYTCSICGKVFKDALGTIETTVEAEILPKLAGESGNLTWVWTEDGVLTISGSGKMEDYSSDAKAPWGIYQSQITEVVLEAGVTSIGAYAFCGYSNLIGLTIPESITSIGESAFYGCSNLTGVTVPEGITSIGSGAFRDCSSLNSVIIPEGVVSIGDSAFRGCKNLTNVTVPEGITSIGSGAFRDCSSLNSVIIPEGVVSIGDSTFRGCKNLTNVTIPEGITGIGSETFYDCSGLTSVIIPEGVTDIGDYAFYNCSSLSNVTIPEGVISIGEFAFSRCSKLTSVIIPEGTTSIGNDAFYGCGGLTSVIIPEGMTSIGESAFNGCSSLTSVKLPESLTSINSYTFSYCYSLTSVTIPENVTYISGDAFKYCSKLASILVNDGNTNYDSVDGVLFNKTHTQLVIYPAGRGTDYQIPAGVTSIGYNAFGGCGELTSVVIPDTVVEMGGRAFDMCRNLTNVVIPEKITSIGYETFCFCSNLVSVAIPEGMTSVGYNAFTACSKLKDIYYGGSESQWNAIKFEEGNYGVTVATIHYNVKHVHDLQYISAKAATCTQSGNAAYYVCATCGAAFKDQAGTQATTGTAETLPALGHTMTKTEAVAPTHTTPGNNEYYTCSRCGKVYKDEAGKTETTVEAETLEKLPGVASGECGEKLHWVLTEDGVLRISGNGAMPDYSTSSVAPWYSKQAKITSVVVEPGVTNVGDYAFYTCLKLAEVELPEGVTSIGEYAFSRCSSLTSVSIPDGVKSIGERAFWCCSGLTSVSIPESVTSIGGDAFSGCSGLTSVSIPDGVTSIGWNAFRDCSGLTSVSIPDGVKSIGWAAFYGCSSLTSVNIPDGVTSIGDSAFYGCSGLTSVSIPESVTYIGVSAFSGCSGLTSVSIPDGVTSIRGFAFYGCSGLTSVSIPDGVTSIGEYAFYVCSGLTSVSIPDGVTSIGQSAFFGCFNLKDVYYSGDEVAWKQIEIGDSNRYLTSAYLHYGLTHICTTHLIPAVAPTCVAAGNNAYYLCDVCGRVYKDEQNRDQTTVEAETLPALGHAMTLTEAKAATCTEDGNNAYYTCGNCHKVFLGEQGEKETTVQAEILPALGHSMVKIDAAVPTCTETGNRAYYTCKKCGKVYQDEAGEKETTIPAETIPALGHSMDMTEGESPTCTEAGNNAYYTCKTCRKVFKDEAGREETTVKEETLAALGHSMIKIEAVDPTCTEAGHNTYYTCSTCHKVFRDEAGKRLTTVSAEVLAAFGHSMVKTVAKEPTCTESGNNIYYTCKTCGKVYQDEVGKKETTVKAETVAALGHTMTKTEATDPTCTEPGNNAYYTCETCHKVYKDEAGKQETTVQGEFLPALGHDMERTEAVAPTHTSTGSNAYYTCKTCHKVFRDEQGITETTLEAETLPRLPGIDSGTCGDLQWLLSDDNILTISGQGRIPDYSGTNLAPWYAYHKQIKGLILEEGVTAVGSFAFYDCGALREVQFPKTLRMVGSSSFAYCDSLRLLDLSKVPETVTEKTLDLSGLAKLAATLDGLVKPSFVWKLETVPGQESAGTLAKLEGTKLEVLRTGTFRLVCREENTGLTGYGDLRVETTTVITPETEQLTSGQSLELKAVAMPFGTELAAKWTLADEYKAYAEVSEEGLLTAKAVTAPVQVTVKAEPASGEVPAEKTIWILPRTTAVGILADGSLVGETLIAELTEKTELQLSARIQPEGAKAEVTWSSSEESVAAVDKAGKVLLLKPGITEITAKSLDGSGLEATLTLKVQYLDGAQTLALSADVPETGLEPGMEAQLTLSGEGAFDAEQVEFAIVQGSSRTATVDEKGLLTAGEVPGTVTVKALLKGDPLERSAEVTVQVIPTLVRDLKLEPQVSQSWGYALKEAGETNVYGEIAFVVNQNRTFQINAQGKDYREQWFGVTNLTYESSDPAVAQVDAKGLVTLTAKEAGECVITVRCRDSLGTETRLHIVLRDSAPRLESTKLTLNSNLIAGVTTGLAESYNNTIQSVTLYDYDKTRKRYEEAPSDSFTAEAEDGTLTVRALGAQKSGTYQLKLVVTCLGGSYDYTLQVKVANSLPKVTVKQIGKFDTFYLDSTAQLTATASGYEVERLKLIGADTFRMDEDGNLFYAESYNPGDKIVTKGTLLVYVEGYQVPVEKNVTVATTKTAPKLTLNPSASAVNRALEDPEFRVKVLWKGNALDLTDAEVKADVGFATVEAQGQYLVFRLTGATGGTAKLSLRLPGWAQAVSLTHKITVDTKLPTVKLGVTTLKLNSLFSAQTARTPVWLTQGNLDISTMDFKAAREEGKHIDLSFDPETDSIEAKFNEMPKEMPKAGTYSYTYTAYLENGTALPSGTIKVTVAATAPKVKLSAASVKLNRYLAGQEKATVKVTLTGGTGYQVTDFEGLPDYMRYDAETSELTVVLPDENFTGETCNLYPTVREEESGQEVPLPTKLTLKVRTLNTNKLTVSLSAKGKLNTVDPDSAIAYTVTKVNNCLGTVESVDLVDQNGDLFQDGDPFQVDLDTSGVKPLVLLRLLPGKSYATNKTYKVRFRFAVCGREVLSSVLSVKVTQTALKVTAPKTAVYYLSQSGPLRCSLKANLPLESVALSTRTAKEFQQALGGQENLRLTGNRVEFKLTNPGALRAGKSYSVQLELTPENAAENTKPTTIKLTVKVMK